MSFFSIFKGDKDRAIMMYAEELCCPVISRDTDFLLFGNVSVVSLNNTGANALCSVFEKGLKNVENRILVLLLGWYRNIGGLRDFHLPLLAALAYNPEGQLKKEELEPFWLGLGWKDDESSMPVVNYVSAWLIQEINDHDKCAKVSSNIIYA